MSVRSAAAPVHNQPNAAVERAAGLSTHSYVVERDGQRLDAFLATAAPDCSRVTAHRLIGEGMVTVNGQIVRRPSQRLDRNSIILMTTPPPHASDLVPEEMPLDLVYEDSDLLVVNKPAGLVVHPSAGHDAHTLVHGLLAYCTDLSGIGGEQRPGIVHRLDRDTSGLLMVAKHDRAHAALSHQFQERSVSKYYLALLQGTPVPTSGAIDAPIARDPHDRKRMAVRNDGRASRTRYYSIAHAAGYTFVVAGLDTGRTHQLRVHFAAIGHPIAGDPLYGTPGGPADRLWLHAWRLAFTRPGDGARIVLEAPPPAVLTGSWTRLSDSEEGPMPFERVLARARRRAIDRGSAAGGVIQETGT